jgi:hypothetical protein
MDDTIGYAVVTIFIIGSIYSLVKQIQQTYSMQNGSKSNKRLLFGNYLSIFSLLGFIISYVLNVLGGLEVIHSDSITSNSTDISCFLFLLVLLIARFIITPKYK